MPLRRCLPVHVRLEPRARPSLPSNVHRSSCIESLGTGEYRGHSEITERPMTSRPFLAAAGALGLVLLGAAGPAMKEPTMTSTLRQGDTRAARAADAIRPFHISVPNSALLDLPQGAGHGRLLH